MSREARHVAALLLELLVAAAEAAAHRRGVTSTYRRKLEASEDMPLDADVFAVPPGWNAPQQVHITLGDQTGTAMTVSWVTVDDVGSSTVKYGLAAEGMHTRYTYYNYTFGDIHHCTLTGLEHGTRYYYAVGVGVGDTERTFWFAPLRVGLIGDLGQTADSNSTLTHCEQHPGDAVLFVGDLSYTDKHPFHDNNRWAASPSAAWRTSRGSGPPATTRSTTHRSSARRRRSSPSPTGTGGGAIHLRGSDPHAHSEDPTPHERP